MIKKNYEIPKLSYENTKRVMEREEALKRLIDSFVDGYEMNRDDIRKKINKLVYEMSEKMGTSIYDICFRTMPYIEPVEHKILTNDPLRPFTETTYDITLRPVEFEFEKGPGYWKGKYYELKDRMQALLDKKEED